MWILSSGKNNFLINDNSSMYARLESRLCRYTEIRSKNKTLLENNFVEQLLKQFLFQ